MSDPQRLTGAVSGRGDIEFQIWSVEVQDKADHSTRTEEVIATSAVRAHRQVEDQRTRVIRSTPLGSADYRELVAAAAALLNKSIRGRHIQFRGSLNDEERALYDALKGMGKPPPFVGGDIGRPRG